MKGKENATTSGGVDGNAAVSRSVADEGENPKTRNRNRNQKPTPAAKFLFFVSQQESSRAQCLDTALDKEERVRILTRKTLNHQRDVSDAAGVEYRA